MQETWRWFGPNDAISLQSIQQAGASGIVSSLSEIPTGEAWPVEAITDRKKTIEDAGLSWSVIESIPVHNDIKTRSRDFQNKIENYKISIKNVGEAGISFVCYNFMPVVDWTRTNLNYTLPNASQALRFEMTDFVAYDVYILKRENAAENYEHKLLEKAKVRLDAMSTSEKQRLEKNIIAGLPGGEGSYNRESIRIAIEEFIVLGVNGLRKNLFMFLQEVVPVAEASGVKLCIHPDDPPFSLFGLPRVVSTADDARELLQAVPSSSNGLTLCTGSYGARGDNDLIKMVEEFGPSIHFVHLRNVKREQDGSFYESNHLDGDNDMIGLIDALLNEEQRRKRKGETHCNIPMRPDHGHLMAAEENNADVKPGYSYIGRLKGLAELRGVIFALSAQR